VLVAGVRGGWRPWVQAAAGAPVDGSGVRIAGSGGMGDGERPYVERGSLSYQHQCRDLYSIPSRIRRGTDRSSCIARPLKLVGLPGA
jgi:hypothetical protein